MTDYGPQIDESGERYCVVDSKEESECPLCGDEFDGYRGLSVHCRHSHDCAVLLRKECAWCGSVMEKKSKQYRPDADRHFCNIECHGKWRSENLVGEDAPRWEGGEVGKPCAICGTTVKRSKSYFEKFENVTCSKECYSKLQSELNQGENNANYDPDAYSTTNCDHCEESFDYLPSCQPGDYCSYSCMAKDATGTNAPNWKGGWVSGDYGPNWDEQRKKALDRDGWECVMCGIGSDESCEKLNTQLHVHHRKRKESFRNEDGTLDYENANSVSNLITLCVVCHGKWEELPVQPEVI